MVEVRSIVVCTDCRVSWAPHEAPTCMDESHRHIPWEVHLHRTPVTLPDGTTVTAVSFDADDPYRRDAPPDYGLYLDERWAPPWAHEHVRWPDYGLPADASSIATVLRAVLDRARAGERVEIGCLGAHGRTGTALACLAVLAGVGADDAVALVRSSYCQRAVETPAQEAFVAAFAG